MYHPDVNKEKNAQQKYVEINEAYETLGDEQKRRIYDSTGMSSNEQQNAEFFEGFQSFGQMFRQWGRSEDDSGHRMTYEEILQEYEKFFSLDENEKKPGSNQVGLTKGANIIDVIWLNFAETVVGVQKIVKYTKLKVCRTCNGKKVLEADEKDICSSCQGSGESNNLRQSVCQDCQGTGLKSIGCSTCISQGVMPEEVQMVITVPKSVGSGMYLRVKDKGHEGLNGVPGDLIIEVKVK